MNLTYETQGSRSYLVYRPETKEIDTLTLGMITRNKIPGLADALYTQMDNEGIVKYNISSKMSFADFLGGTVKVSRLLKIFSNIVKTMTEMDEYMLEYSSLLLEKKYVYIDISDYSADLICIPVICREEKNEKDIGVFFEEIVRNLIVDDSDSQSWVFLKLLNYFNGNKNFSLSEFNGLLKNCADSGKKEKITKPEKQQIRSEEDIEKYQPVQPKVDSVSTAYSRNEIPSSKNNEMKEEADKNMQYISPIKEKSIAGKDKSWLEKIWGTKEKEPKKEEKRKKKKDIKDGKNPLPDRIEIPGDQHEKISNVQQKVIYNNIGERQKNFARDVSVQDSGIVPKADVQDYDLKSPQSGQRVAADENRQNKNVTIMMDDNISAVTTFLEEGYMCRPYLVRKRNNERVLIDKDVYRIGRDTSELIQYCVAENNAVGRCHASIITEENEYYIMDLNSKNHTYVNEKMIPSNERIKLSNGDKIRLANENFEFLLY